MPSPTPFVVSRPRVSRRGVSNHTPQHPTHPGGPRRTPAVAPTPFVASRGAVPDGPCRTTQPAATKPPRQSVGHPPFVVCRPASRRACPELVEGNHKPLPPNLPRRSSAHPCRRPPFVVSRFGVRRRTVSNHKAPSTQLARAILGAIPRRPHPVRGEPPQSLSAGRVEPHSQQQPSLRGSP